MSRRARLIGGVVAGGALLALGGCGGGLFSSRQAAPEVYELSPAAGAPLAPRLAATVVLARPTTRPGLEGDRIAVRLPDRRLDAFAGSRWSAPLPVVVESLLLETLRARGGFAAVVFERLPFDGRYLLHTEVREFTAVYAATGSAPVVQVALHGELGRLDSRRLLGSFDGRAERPAASNRLRDVLAAFEAASAEALDALAAGAHAAALRDAAAGVQQP